MNSNTASTISMWLEKHTLERILQAIAETKAKGARSSRYTDQILIGWEANGYPATREEMVAKRKAEGNKPPAPADTRKSLPEFKDGRLVQN